MLGFGGPAERPAPPLPPVPPSVATATSAATAATAADRSPAAGAHAGRVLVGRDVEAHGAAAHGAHGHRDDDPLPAPAAGPREPAAHDRDLVDALHRVADSFEKVAASLDADRRERRVTLDDMDSLVRTLVGELRPPAAVPPVVVAGTIDATAVATTDAPPSLSPGDDAIDLTAPDGADARRPFERARRR